MNFPNPLLPTEDSLHNPIANYIRNSYREEVDRMFSIMKSSNDYQYKELVRTRAHDLWRYGIFLSNQYAENNPQYTEYKQQKKEKSKASTNS